MAPREGPQGKPRERSLNLNNTIFTVTAPRYAYMQNLSQIRDVACSTCCMVLHGFLMDSLLNLKRTTIAIASFIAWRKLLKIQMRQIFGNV